MNICLKDSSVCHSLYRICTLVNIIATDCNCTYSLCQFICLFIRDKSSSDVWNDVLASCIVHHIKKPRICRKVIVCSKGNLCEGLWIDIKDMLECIKCHILSIHSVCLVAELTSTPTDGCNFHVKNVWCWCFNRVFIKCLTPREHDSITISEVIIEVFTSKGLHLTINVIHFIAFSFFNQFLFHIYNILLINRSIQ